MKLLKAVCDFRFYHSISWTGFAIHTGPFGIQHYAYEYILKIAEKNCMKPFMTYESHVYTSLIRTLTVWEAVFLVSMLHFYWLCSGLPHPQAHCLCHQKLEVWSHPGSYQCQTSVCDILLWKRKTARWGSLRPRTTTNYYQWILYSFHTQTDSLMI